MIAFTFFFFSDHTEWTTSKFDPKKVVGPNSHICQSTGEKVGCNCEGSTCKRLNGYYCDPDVDGGDPDGLGLSHGYCCTEGKWTEAEACSKYVGCGNEEEQEHCVNHKP